MEEGPKKRYLKYTAVAKIGLWQYSNNPKNILFIVGKYHEHIVISVTRKCKVYLSDVLGSLGSSWDYWQSRQKNFKTSKWCQSKSIRMHTY